MSPGDTIRNIVFLPNIWQARQRQLRCVTFNCAGFSGVLLQKLTFTDCVFIDCLFLGTVFKEVEFHNCKFENCNFWKARFEQCYIDPDSILLERRFKVEAANVGISLFQSLLSNFAESRQDAFYMKADIKFRRWKRYQLSHDLRRKKIGWWTALSRRCLSISYEVIAGFGYRPGRFFIWTLILFLLVSTANYYVIGSDIAYDQATGTVRFIDILFYSFSVMTVLGFSSLVPDTPIAKLITVVQALAAVGWLGIFTSVLVKRFLR